LLEKDSVNIIPNFSKRRKYILNASFDEWIKPVKQAQKESNGQDSQKDSNPNLYFKINI